MARRAAATGTSVVIFSGFFVMGIAWASTQRAGAPSTIPLNEAPPPDPKIERDVRPVPFHFSSGRSHLYLHPFLEFRSLSPDRFWTVFAPRLRGQSVPVTTHSVDRQVENLITTWCNLEADNYSHLNTFTELEFSSVGKISLNFSPCPERRFEVQRSDYPYGRAARFAYLGADGRFLVAEASSGEKGPFTELASAPCARDDALTVTLFADEQPKFILQFDDFLAQCSAGLSPSAGWGVPQNSIQFSLSDDDSETAFLFFSLASTSVGIGFDSVGHLGGMYRNRITVIVP